MSPLTGLSNYGGSCYKDDAPTGAEDENATSDEANGRRVAELEALTFAHIMATTIHVKRPANFPKQCVRCMSEHAEMRKFTDTAHGGVVSVTATLDIPVCDRCWRAPRPWWIAGGILLLLFFASSVPFAIAQDKHANIPRIIPIAMLLLMVGCVVCFFVARRRSPVRLVPTRIDRENIRIKFFNHAYAERFVDANKETAKTINPWKYG